MIARARAPDPRTGVRQVLQFGRSCVAVVLLCFKVVDHIMGVLSQVGPEVDAIYCVDDCRPQDSGIYMVNHCTDQRVRVIRHEINQGVDGAVMTGYRAAVKRGADVVVKIYRDGQMDPVLLPFLVTPVIDGSADYTKGNQFWELRQIKQMPLARRVGSLGLSFLSKANAGCSDLYDPGWLHREPCVSRQELTN